MAHQLIKEEDLVVYTEGNVIEKNKAKTVNENRKVSDNSVLLHAIGLVPQTDPKTVVGKITLLDGDLKIFEIDKAKLALAVEAAWTPDLNQGLTRLYPYHYYSVEINKHFLHFLGVIGDVKGLVFYLQFKR
jgi:hypothetical protein